MRGKHKRLFSLFLAFALAANLLSAAMITAGAAEASGGVILSKTVTLQADGTYKIDLSGFVTGQTVTSQVTSHVPLDVVLVLDASSSMLKFKNTPETYTTTDEVAGWGAQTKRYPATATDQTNLWAAGTGMSRKSLFYSHEEKAFVTTTTSTPVRGSAMIPVKPGDKIYCSSFRSATKTGGSQDGICVSFYRSSGNLLKSVSAKDVYTEYSEDGYITVPESAYVMNVPVWNADSSKVIKNLSLGEERYEPVSKLEFEAVRAKILQQQIQSFADSLAKNALDTGVTHKLSVITYGGEYGNGVGNQGRYEKHVGVNGYNDFIYTNTGLFVNGAFKNYFNGNNDTADGVERAAYTPVFADELDTSKSYYYFVCDEDSSGGSVQQASYDAASGNWLGVDGVVLKPQQDPYSYNSRTQFYTRQMVAPTKLTAKDYKNALPSILGADNQINPVVQSAIDRYVARGTTHPELGLFMANYVLDNNPAKTVDANGAVVRESKQVVILFTDGQTNDLDEVNGEPTYQTAFYRANRIKGLNKAELYTICLADNENTSEATEMAKWLDQLSSNHPAVNGGNGSHADAATIFDRTKAVSGGKYSKSVAHMSELNEIFTSITTDISTSTTDVQLGADAVMQDYLANGLILPDDFGFDNIQVSLVGVEATETNGVITYKEKTTANAIKDFTYNQQTGKYEYSSIALTVSFDKVAGMVSVTGFDYTKYYVAPGRSNGFKLKVQITGVEATEATPTDVLLDTNTKQSGIAYVADGKAGLHPFEQPKTQLASKTYVMDYAKSMTISTADWGDVIGMADCSRLKTASSVDHIDTPYGTFTKNGDSYIFEPSTMQWDQPASFYVLRTLAAEDVPEGVTTGNRQWMRINVVPANNIYFEDDFSDIGYTGNWSVDGTTAGSTENPEGATGDADGIHGWEENLKDPQYSDGSAHKGVVGGGTMAEATFTFIGKGVDIYSRTNSTAGTVLVTLRGGTYHEDGGYYEVSKTLIVDNQSVSGDYYQIPTVSFMDLPYDTYTVTVRVTTAAADRFTYYLDGIRVYSPLSQDIGYAVAEQGAEVSLIRDLLAKTGKNSAVFIDKTADGSEGVAKDYSQSEYGLYGPKNEVYLAPGQSITFKVDVREDAYYYVGMKSPAGNDTAMAKASNGDATIQQLTITHSTDLYYHVTPDADGYITIQNSGAGLLSLTKLRIAGPSESAHVMTVSAEDAVFAVRRFSSLPIAGSGANADDSWSPDTSDVQMLAPVFAVLAGLCLVAMLVIPKIRRVGHEA